jgi:transcriptional regulator with XRE-family HTH domain
MQRLNRRIQEARRLAAMTRAELARRVGVKASAAVQWEYEDGTSPTVRNLIAIANLTSVSFEWLATGRGAPRSKVHQEVPAVAVEGLAQDLFEEHVLKLVRELPVNARDPLVEFLRAVLRKKS